MAESKDLVRKFSMATSKPARQTYLHTFLFINATSILLGVAVSAYILFYRNFIPQIGIEKVIHLQYGDGPHPYGMTSLDSELISRQPYDIFFSLNIPRSPPNLVRGNFMLSLALLAPNHKYVLSNHQKLGISEQKSPLARLQDEDIIFTARRPALLKYTSNLVSISWRLSTLLLHTLGLRPESETLVVPMGESVSFARGKKNVPNFALLEIQAGQEFHIYDMKILFKARFSGLRWFMYNYRVASFLLFTGLFWILSLMFAALAWIILNIYAPNSFLPLSRKKMDDFDDTDHTPKVEDTPSDDGPDLSDTPRNFPTYGRQPKLKYKSDTKNEPKNEEANIVSSEADDEGEDAEYVGVRLRKTADSGIGTSNSEGGQRNPLRRRMKSGSR